MTYGVTDMTCYVLVFDLDLSSDVTAYVLKLDRIAFYWIYMYL